MKTPPGALSRGCARLATATDPGAIPKPLRAHLEVIELPGYSEREKLAIAQSHLLKRRFDAPGSAGWLAAEPPAASAAAASDAIGDGPSVVADRAVTAQELAALPSLRTCNAYGPESAVRAGDG